MEQINAMVLDLSSSGATIRPRRVPAPTRGRGQVSIEVRAASLNRADLAARSGTHTASTKAGWSVVGLDCAGVVVDADADAAFKPGDRVMTLVGGGLAEQVVVDARVPLRLPEAWSFELGAAAVLALMTGHNALRAAGRMSPGDSVLVNGARSAVGQMTVRIAHELGAGRVLAGMRTRRDEAFLKEIGSDDIIETGSGGFAGSVLEVTDGRGVDVIIDHVGGPYLADHIAAAALGGRIVGVGRLGGPDGQLDMEALALKRLTVVGVTFRTRTDDDRAAISAGVRGELSDALESGRLDPRIDRVLPWTEVLAAQDVLASDSHLGKIVLEVVGDRV